jgi:death-on-curing protein
VKRIEWLSLDMVIDIHAELLRQFGGYEGLRDQGLLESALARPRNKAEYGESDFATLAAAVCFGLSRNHPFLDGNKRVALAALIVFLGLNGIDFVAPEAEATATMMAVAAGEADEELLARWVRDHLPR